MGTNELLRREVAPGSRAAGLIDRAEASLHRAEVLTGQLRSNLERRPRANLVDLDDALSGVLDDLRQVMGEAHRVELARSSEHLVVLVDPGLFGSTLINLALNSRAVDPTGIVTISVRRASPEEFEASFAAPVGETAAAYARIEFRDDGPGVPADVASRIFEPYFSTTDGGVGLGLAIARSFMRDGGGNLCYDGSQPGACFVLYLPLVEPERLAETASVSPATGFRPPFSFAVVDDEPLVLKTVSDLLQARGHEVDGFVRAEEAIDAFESGAKVYDLLLTDLHLPGMSGIGAAKAARSVVPDLPVAYMTGLADAFADEIELNERTIVVEKPLRLADIDRIIELGRRAEV